MKVCTDACIFGAWFAEKINSSSLVLDIGSGTGLLMMMLAQKNNAPIHGIEIDFASFEQSKENIQNSKWKNQLTIFPGDVRTFVFQAKYDFIISNPPFFENDLQAYTNEANVARHSKSLKLEELLQAVEQNLTSDGSFGILLPYHRLQYFEALASEKGFYPFYRLLVKQTPMHPFFRSIVHLSRYKNISVPQQEMTIQDGSGDYTPDFVDLLKDYYLYLPITRNP